MGSEQHTIYQCLWIGEYSVAIRLFCSNMLAP